MNPHLPSAAPAREHRAARVIGAFSRLFRHAERGAGPLLDLALRLWIARIFFVSAVVKLADWDTALYLAANEYPVSWLAPASAALAGVAVELAGSVLLAAGLATRAAALALIALSAVIQIEYRALDQHLFWIALLAWVAVHGGGRLSLDAMLARGLADSAVPLAGTTLRLLARLTRHALPLFQLALRLWLAATLLAFAASVLPEAPQFAPAFALGCALALAAGLATRLAGLLLALAAAAQAMGGAAQDAAYWMLAGGLIAVFGAGRWSADAALAQALRRRYPQLDGGPAFALEEVPRVVIVGAGFGGLACAAALTRARVAVTLVDRHNYHLFQPLLYQVATAGLSPGDIATTVRAMFREHFNVRVLLGEVSGVDSARREVLVGGQRLPYNYLVLATGAAHSYFGRDDWAPHAPGLKRIEDATEVRRRLLSAFERAEASEDSAERAALLTFLVVGGGPTGVELAGAIAELARYGMDKEFRRFDPAQARVLLVQAAPRLLPTFPEDLSAETRRALEMLGVEVLVDSRVERIDADGVSVNGQRIAARTVLWAAGVVASPAAQWLGAQADGAGRVKVGADLSVPGLPEVFVIGDTAAANAWNGQPVPGLAPAAKQGGEYVAQVIRARAEGRAPPPPFAYRHLGSLATIGRKAAVADFGFVRLRGAIAWWFWGAVHVAFLVGLRNRISVMWDWFWAYLTLRGGTRLITGGAAQTAQAPTATATSELPRAA